MLEKNGLRMLRKQENCITYLSITLVSVQVISIDQTFSFLFPNQPVLLRISAASRDGHTYNVVCGKVCAGKLDQSAINFLPLGQRNKRILSFPWRLAVHARTGADAGGSRLRLSFLILLPSVRHAPLRYMPKVLG